MNYFAHGRDYLAEPYVLAGTAVPDWLNVADRRTRVRAKVAAPFLGHADSAWAALARGIVQHHADDGWFHRTRAFVELSARFTGEIVASFPSDTGPRAGFVGHILVEMLLDAALIHENRPALSAYYLALAEVDPAVVGRAVNAMAGQPTARLEPLIPRFLAERFLYDYAENAKLLGRLNAVLGRVGLTALPATFVDFLASARVEVAARRSELLDRPPAPLAVPFPVIPENAP